MARKSKKEVEEEAPLPPPKRLRYLCSVYGNSAGRSKFEEEEEAGKVLYA